MYHDHYYTLNRVCPCSIDSSTIKQATALFRSSPDVRSFVEAMSRSRLIGQRIWYDEAAHTIYITKIFACDSGGGCPENDSLIGQRCHCDYYNRSAECYPKHYCQCSAEFYRPMFAPFFGEDVVIEPVETVLSGDEQCTFAIKLGRKENKQC